MHIKKEVVNGTGKVNQALVVTLSCETETREHLMGLNGSELNIVHRTYIFHGINWPGLSCSTGASGGLTGLRGLKGDQVGTRASWLLCDHGGYKHLSPPPPVGFCSISLVILAPQSCSCIKGGAQSHAPSPGHLHLAGARGTCLAVLVRLWVHWCCRRAWWGWRRCSLVAVVGTQRDRGTHTLRRCVSNTRGATRHWGGHRAGW